MKWAVVAGVTSMSLAACSGTSVAPSASAIATPSSEVSPAAVGSPGPSTPSACDSAAVAEAIAADLNPQEILVSLDSFECSGDYSYAFATTGPADGNEEGQVGVTIVLKREDAGWAGQDRGAVCGTTEVTDGPAPYPGDAKVPEDIWLSACQTN